MGDALDVFRTATFFEKVPGNRSVNAARVDVDKPKPPGELSRDTTLSRGSRTIDRNYPMKISRSRVHTNGNKFSRACPANAMCCGDRRAGAGSWHVSFPLR